MIDDMSLRNLSPATQRSYLHAVTKFSRHCDRSPDRLGLEDVRAFQVHLVSQGVSWPALNQTVCALRYFFGVTLDRAEIPERIVYARTPHKLPTILSADEVVRFLEAVPSLKARTALTTAYAAGLRASERLGLRDHRCVHPAILRPPFAKRSRAHAMVTANLGHRHAALGLAQDRRDLRFAVSRHLHLNLLMHLAEKILLPQPLIFGGDYRVGIRSDGSEPI